MSNDLVGLNDALFEQLNRLNNSGLDDEKLKQEIDRSKALAGIAQKIIKNGELVLKVKTELSPNVIKNSVPMLGSDRK